MGSNVIFRFSFRSSLFIVYQYYTGCWFYFSYFLLYHVLDYDRRVSPLFLILFHEFGNILRRIACVGIVRADDQDRVIFISMDPACEE